MNMKNAKSRSHVDAVEVVKIIRVKTQRGYGTEKDPIVSVIQYWDLNNNLLCEIDYNVAASSAIKDIDI